jgi:hypothetical protein
MPIGWGFGNLFLTDFVKGNKLLGSVLGQVLRKNKK